MLNISSEHHFIKIALIVGFLLLSPLRSFAHMEGEWNDFMIDNKNDMVDTTLEYVRKQIADIVLGRNQGSSWPDPMLLQLRISLMDLQEEMEFMLNHLQEVDGIHLQIQSTLLENPRAGRAVAASYAVELALELVEYIATLDDAYAFKRELNEDGKGAYIFDLMDSYTQSMRVYKLLQDKARESSEQQFIITTLSKRTLWQDVKFHLGRFFRWLGMDDLAVSLQTIDVSRVNQTAAEITE